MKLKKSFKGSVSGLLLMSVPVVALLSIGPWSSASQVLDVPSVVVDGNLAIDTSLTGVNADSLKIQDLSDWKYTGKSDKSGKSGKSKKSPKSGKSDKSKKSGKSGKGKK